MMILPSNPNRVAKCVAVFHMAVSTFIFIPIMMDPIQMYDAVDQAYLDTTPPRSMDAMLHMSYAFCYLMVLQAAIAVCLVVSHGCPNLGMSMIASSWLLNASCQVLYPWPVMVKDVGRWSWISMPPPPDTCLDLHSWLYWSIVAWIRYGFS